VVGSRLFSGIQNSDITNQRSPVEFRDTDAFVVFFAHLLKISPHTRLLFTSRETLPAPFDTGFQTRRLGALDPADALHLVAEVMQNAGIAVPSLNVEDLDEQFGALARSANYHARALTLLTQSLAALGDNTRDTLLGFNADYAQLMAELERKHPGERENSLFASLELSLRRLPPDVRAVVEALAVYQGGADVISWAMVAECEPQAAYDTGIALVQVGLAEYTLTEFPYYFKIDPALPAWLAAHTPPELLAARQQRWVEAMVALSGFLYQQRSQNAHLAHDLARLTEANLVAMLGALEKVAEPEQLVEEAQKVESLFSTLSRPQVLQFAQGIRERAAARLAEGDGWSHAQFLHQDAAVDRLLEQGNLPAAFQLARETLARCEQAGTDAYPEAAYDGAMAHARLGRVLKNTGQAEQALPYLQTARQRFLALAEVGDANAEYMASACLTEIGDCYQDLGQYEAAAGQYQQAIEWGEKRGDFRGVAVRKTQLATTWMLQKNYPEALRLYEEAKIFFERNGEAAMLAEDWHGIGRVHQGAQNYPAAEKAYQQSLEIRIREKLKQYEAASLNQLGNLYDAMNRLEDAVRIYERAIDIYAALKDNRYEGIIRNNLADTLIQLGRLAESRTQLLRAIECKAQFGHAAAPWTTWAILSNLETAEGNFAAAAEARAKAMQAYGAYRRDGGESRSNHFQLIAATAQAIQAGQAGELIPQLEEILGQDVPAFVKALLRALLALLRGQGGPALADDPELHYMDAVELGLVFGLTPPAPLSINGAGGV
jgi:tetratricopeptide (TPR) repeat protein